MMIYLSGKNVNVLDASSGAEVEILLKLTVLIEDQVLSRYSEFVLFSSIGNELVRLHIELMLMALLFTDATRVVCRKCQRDFAGFQYF